MCALGPHFFRGDELRALCFTDFMREPGRVALGLDHLAVLASAVACGELVRDSRQLSQREEQGQCRCGAWATDCSLVHAAIHWFKSLGTERELRRRAREVKVDR